MGRHGAPAARGLPLRLTLPGGPLLVPAGAYGCLLGGPGAGKSAALQSLAGLPGVAENHGAVRQHDSLPPGSIGGALRWALARTGVPRPQWAGREAGVLAEFGLDGAAAVVSLNPEQRLRALLARALLRDPAVLLLDDPLALVGDQTGMQALLLATQRRRGLTVLQATRRRDDAIALADHLALLDGGRILQQGTVAALYARPATIDLAHRLGPANVLPGQLVAIEDDEAMVQLDGGPRVAAELAEPVACGAACRLLLRPERIALARIAAASLGDTAIAALLRAVSDRGDHVRLELAIGTDTQIVAHRAAALGSAGFQVGAMVAVAWQARDALVYAAEGETP